MEFAELALRVRNILGIVSIVLAMTLATYLVVKLVRCRFRIGIRHLLMATVFSASCFAFARVTTVLLLGPLN